MVNIIPDVAACVTRERRVSDCILSETDMADTASAELAGIRKKIARAELSIKEKMSFIL